MLRDGDFGGLGATFTDRLRCFKGRGSMAFVAVFFHGCMWLAQYARLINLLTFLGNLVKLSTVVLLPRWAYFQHSRPLVYFT